MNRIRWIPIPPPRGAAGLALAIAVLTCAVPRGEAGDVFTNWRGLAIRGADPVAYFSESRYVKGDAAHGYEWRGATWRFVSAANRARFAADPERYAPQYGGYCAYAMARGDSVSSDPAEWTVVDSKLYLNYSANVKAKWERDIPRYVAEANRHWNSQRND